MRSPDTLQKIFQKKNRIIIGVIHFPPLLGYPNFPGFKVAEQNALKDLHAFESGGVDGIIFENNYDTPHYIVVPSEIVSAMTFLGAKIKAATTLPMGVSVLWNDYRAALAIAKILDLQFIRIPVFVDRIKTAYGVIEGNAKEALKLRRSLRAERVALFTDIHVKHAELLSRHTLVRSARLAIRRGADALIVTGNWTGQAPQVQDLKSLREAAGNFPILIGSGANIDNIKALCSFANGVIVSTSLKKGIEKQSEVNVKTYNQRVSPRRVKQFVHAALR